MTEQTDVGRHVQSLTIGTGVLLVGIIMLLFGLQAAIAAQHRQTDSGGAVHAPKTGASAAERAQVITGPNYA